MDALTCICRGWAGDGAWLRAAQANPHAHHPRCPRPTSVSDHAVDRFIERHKPTCYWRDDFQLPPSDPRYRLRARQQLVLLMQEAVLDTIEDGVNSIWRTPSGILLGVRERVVATVLPLGSRRPDRRPKRRRT